MDDARKLLDSLMGQTRNMDVKEAKKKKGQNFKEENVCKFYLLGFCPQNENLFKNTKRHLGDCEKIHSDLLREEFQKHPEKEEYEVKYLRDLVRKLESVVRTADDAVNRQRRAIEQANKELQERGPNDVARQEIVKIRENCNLLLAQAEELAEQGDIEGSKAKQSQFEQTKALADDYEQKSCMPIREEVCDICGLRPEEGDGMRKFSHTEGKIHVGFMRVREALNKYRDRMEELDQKYEGSGSKPRSDRKEEGERDRARDRDRDRGQEEQGERDRPRDRARDRAQEEPVERDRTRDRDRNRARDREYPAEREGVPQLEAITDGVAPVSTDRGPERSRRRDPNRDYKEGGDGPRGYDDGSRRGGGEHRSGRDRENPRHGDRGYEDYGYSRKGGGDRDYRGGGGEREQRGERRAEGGDGYGRRERRRDDGSGDAYGYGYGRGNSEYDAPPPGERRPRSRSRDQKRY